MTRDFACAIARGQPTYLSLRSTHLYGSHSRTVCAGTTQALPMSTCNMDFWGPFFLFSEESPLCCEIKDPTFLAVLMWIESNSNPAQKTFLEPKKLTWPVSKPRTRSGRKFNCFSLSTHYSHDPLNIETSWLRPLQDMTSAQEQMDHLTTDLMSRHFLTR